MRVLDLFCGAGGAGMGYRQVRFDIVGVDSAPQPRYPGPFIQADALALDMRFIRSFDAIHASPPCQGYTSMRFAPGAKGAPRLIAEVRTLLTASGLPWVIENVAEARTDMRNPIMLCGTAFGLGACGCELRRHRLFESSFDIRSPGCAHSSKPVVGVYGGHARIRSASHGGRRTRDIWPGGHKPVAAEAMGMSWATLAEMSEAIPPAYTRHIGIELLRHLAAQSRAILAAERVAA